MKTKRMSFLTAVKTILSNDRGEVGDLEVEESPEEGVEEATEEAEIEASEEVEEGSIEVAAETEAELEAEVEAAIDDGATDEEVKEMIRSFTLKVDGKEFTREFDLNDEEALVKQFQLAAKGQQSMQELQELKNAYSSELKKILNDPFAALKALDENFDPLEVSSKYIDQLTKENEMSPEEKANLQREREFKALKEERDRLKQENEDRANEAERMALAEELQNDIMDVLSADDELVADRETVALVAENLMWAAENNMHDITAKDVLPHVKEQLRASFQKSAARFKSTDALKASMGDELLNKLRDERVKEAKKQIKNATSIKKDVSASKSKKDTANKVNLSSLFR